MGNGERTGDDGQGRSGGEPRTLAGQLAERAWSQWARYRHRADFDRVAAFLLFVGYPRSGHSLLGAMLNAHHHAVVSHELDAPALVLRGCSRDALYARILARARGFDRHDNTSNYRYQIPNQWQGRFTELRLIGDKRGGAATRHLAAHPDLLERVRALVRVPLRLVHVVRSPLDNIAAISLWHGLSLHDSADFYFRHWATTMALDAACAPGEVLALRHESVIRDPRGELARLGGFLGLERDPAWLDDCAGIVFRRSTLTRGRVAFDRELARDIERRARDLPLLAGYSFDPGERDEP
jgi:Sulfotransferase family